MKRALDIAWAVIPWTLLLVLLLNLAGVMQAMDRGAHLAAWEFTIGMSIAAIALGLYACVERGR